MTQRIITALWGIPLLIVLVCLGTPSFLLLITVAAILGTIEFYRIASLSDGEPLTIWGFICILGLISSTLFEDRFTFLLLASAAVLPLIWLFLVSPRETALIRWSWTLLGILYIGWMLSRYVALRDIEQGTEWVLLALFSTFACDTAALFAGRAWGKHAMAPSISPGKTWEGAATGLTAAMAAPLIINTILTIIGLGLPIGSQELVFLGMLIGISAQIGDLWESRLKRQADIKDSGTIIPGHGGILDRIDSIIFTGVVVYYYVVWMVV